jgi:hypothetical protein
MFSGWHLDSAGQCFSCEEGALGCGDDCRHIFTERIWMCNGVCQDWNLPCNGTCRGFSKLYVKDSSYWDALWKCPFEDVCISIFHLCNPAHWQQYPNKDTDSLFHLECKNGINKSRLVCDNADKFDVILNCTDRNLQPCPGNKTQQCIFGEAFCNGIIDCMDR